LSVPREPPPHGLSEIDKALNALDVQENTRKEARAIYRRAYAMGAAHGRKSVEGLAAASVYAACKQSGLPKPLDEIAATLDVDKMEVERAYTYLVNEMGYLPTYSITDNETAALNKPRLESSFPAGGVMDLHGLDVAKFLEKKGTYEFLRLLKEKPRRWKTLEKELALSPRTLSERISQALELGFIEKVRRLKIGATYYRLTGKGNDIFEAMTGDTRIY
jgi:DNA-binding HxlR family transcriptional regulator